MVFDGIIYSTTDRQSANLISHMFVIQLKYSDNLIVNR